MAAKRTRRAGVAALSLLAALSLGLSACTETPFIGGSDEANTIDGGLAGSIDEAIASAMQLSGSTAAVIGVWTGSGEYVRGYGEGVEASSPIRGAQASQPVMCALLLDLVAEGKVSLDRAVAEDLPRQVGLEGITYGQLCSATSGLADFKSPALIDIFTNNPTRPWSDRELLTQALAHSPLAEPGTELHVSDTGALLLARALRQVTGSSVSSMLEERVFGPAGMHSSTYPVDPLATNTLPGDGMTGLTYPSSGGAPVCSVPGEAEGETVPVEPVSVDQLSPSMLGGAGAAVTTAGDLKRFYESYLSGAFGEGSAELVTALSTPEPAAAEGEEAAAEAPAEGEEPSAEQAAPVDGWAFGLEKVGPLYGMSGAMTGSITAAYHDPAGGFTVVVALNNSSAGAAFAKALAFELAAIAGLEVGWTAEDQAAALAERAVCQPAPEAAAEEAPAE